MTASTLSIIGGFFLFALMVNICESGRPLKMVLRFIFQIPDNYECPTCGFYPSKCKCPPKKMGRIRTWIENKML